MAKIIRQTTVIRDGMHNAFTDLQYWQGCYWIGYRKGAGHVSMDGEAVVSVSADRRRFREVAHFHVPGDNRDPKLLPVDENRMAAYFPSWTRGVGPRDLQHYISFSPNGFDWEEPRPILEPRLWLWRIREHDGRYYGLVQNLQGDWSDGKKPHQLELIVSDDLVEWETLCRIGEEYGLNESDIFWHEDGEAWIVARSVLKGNASFFCSAQPPYTEWEVSEMGPMVHAPVFLAHQGDLYVAGRSSPEKEGVRTFPFGGASLGLWRVERGGLEPVLRIPATGDCSYPGMIKDPEGRICMSYYSQHAYAMGVVEPPSGLSGESGQRASDVYFAELELP
ncbi:MAG: hypothetical protein ACLFWL_17015 [Candidatus Brocadiia bacterium]